MAEPHVGDEPVPVGVEPTELVNACRKAPEERRDRQLRRRRLNAFEKQLGAAALPREAAFGLGAEDLLAAGRDDLDFTPALAVEEP